MSGPPELFGGGDDLLVELPVPTALEPLSGLEPDALDFPVQLGDMLESRCPKSCGP